MKKKQLIKYLNNRIDSMIKTDRDILLIKDVIRMLRYEIEHDIWKEYI